MARQDRAEATRRKILDASVDVFNDVGFDRASLNDIIARSGVTKGALYFHFDSKEALAREVIMEGARRRQAAAEEEFRSSAPALERLIRLTVVSGWTAHKDEYVRCANKLDFEIGAELGTLAETYDSLWSSQRDLIAHAIEDGDLRQDLDPDTAAHTSVTLMVGTRSLFALLEMPKDLATRMGELWKTLLTAWVTDTELEYFLEYVERTVTRLAQDTTAHRST